MFRVLTVLAALTLAACGDSSTKKTIPIGEACTPGDTTLVCATNLCLALDNQSGFCTITCNDDCPEGFFCQGAGRYGRVCKRLGGCKEEVDCPSGHTCNTETGNCFIKVNRGLCSPCQDVSQCPAGGSCFTALASGEQFCTTACGAGDTCPTDFECQTIPAGRMELS